MAPRIQESSDISPTPTIFLLPTIEPSDTPAPKILGRLEPTIVVTPTPTIAPTSTPVPTPIPVVTDLETLFTKYADEFHVDKEELKKIARCESGFNTQAVAGDYLGMFQFATRSWISVRTAMGLDQNPDLRRNAEESIRTTAYMLARGQQNAWPNCK